MGVAATALPAMLLILVGSRTAEIFTDDAAVIHAVAPLILPLATVMLSERRWSSCQLVGGAWPHCIMAATWLGDAACSGRAAFDAGPCSPILPHALHRSRHPMPAANSATALLGGILRGSGRQKVGAVVNGAANYGVGLPLQLLFAFKLGAGVAGLWWGIAIAATLQALVLAVLVSKFDWQREAGRAAKLVRHLSQGGLAAGEQRQRHQAAHDAAMQPGSPEVGAPPLL